MTYYQGEFYRTPSRLLYGKSGTIDYRRMAYEGVPLPNGSSERKRKTYNKLKRLYERDPLICVYCIKRFPPSALTMEHIVPVSLGGGSDLENLVLACQPCNTRRGNAPFLIMYCERVTE